jgi:hypothetical protein
LKPYTCAAFHNVYTAYYYYYHPIQNFPKSVRILQKGIPKKNNDESAILLCIVPRLLQRRPVKICTEEVPTRSAALALDQPDATLAE